MDFPLDDLIDEHACYERRVALLHPGGRACPDRKAADRLGTHRRHRAPVIDYRCGHRGRAFNAFATAPTRGTRRPPSPPLLTFRGIARSGPTARMARELGCDREHLPEMRHRLQERARIAADRDPLGDPEVEADECYVNAGEKGIPHPDPDDPPRRRAKRRRGHGTFANDRPPVAGVVGRESGAVRLEV
jgi:hypothetical protein